MVYLTAFGFRIVALLLSLVNAAVFPLSVFWTPSLKGQTLLGDVTVTAPAPAACIRRIIP